MAKRRTRIDTSQFNMPDKGKAKDANHFDKCLRLFLDEYEVRNLSVHTVIWYKDHIKTLYKALKDLDLYTGLEQITEHDIKQCIIYLKNEKKLSPTTINHTIKAAFVKIVVARLYKKLVLAGPPVLTLMCWFKANPTDGYTPKIICAFGRVC